MTTIHHLDKPNTNHILIARSCAAAHAARIEYPGGEEVCVPAGTTLERGSYVIEYYDSLEDAVSAMVRDAYQWSQDQWDLYRMINGRLQTRCIHTVDGLDAGTVSYRHTWSHVLDAEYWLDNLQAIRAGIHADNLTPGLQTQVLVHDGQFFLGGIVRGETGLISRIMRLLVRD